MNRKTVRAVLVILLCSMLIITVGCGGQEQAAQDNQSKSESTEEQTEEETSEEEQQEEQVEFDNFVGLTQISDFIETFELLKWSFEDNSFKFTFEGVEEIDGTEANKVTMVAEEGENQGEFEIWVDEKGDPVKLIADGEKITQGVSTVWMSVKNMLFLPFTMARGTLFNHVTQTGEGTVLSWDGEQEGSVDVEKTGTQSIGDLQCDTYAVHTEWQSEDRSGDVTMYVGNFDDFQMIIKVEEEGKVVFQVDDLQLR